MKKFLASILVICLMLSVCACGKSNTDVTEKNEPETTVSAQNETTEAPKETGKPASTGSISLDDVMNHPVTPADDFKYDLDNVNNGIAIYGYEGNDDIVVIPDTIDGKPVTLIEKMTFAMGSKVKGIRISDSVKRLEQTTFTMNENLQVVVCGSGLTEIGGAAFQDCANLHTLILNDGLTSIENMAFSGCHALKELEVPDSVTEMISSPFFGLGQEFTVIGKAGSKAEEVAMSNKVSFRAK